VEERDVDALTERGCETIELVRVGSGWAGRGQALSFA
jgi:hypothetical protein